MKEKIQIGNRLIGKGEPTFVIAEIGSNHDNKFSQAIEMIDIAVESGVDAVKFQLYYAASLWPKNSRSYQILKPLETDRHWIDKLIEYCGRRKIIFLATPFDKEAIDLLDKANVPALKWPSSEIYDLPLLKYAAQKKKSMIMATGACRMLDVEKAVNAVKTAGNTEIILLHCVSAYPTKPKDANLRIMDALREKFSVPVGFSDHTEGISVALAAVARGANVIEKHFTISRKLTGPDHGFALEPNELREMTQGIREVEQSLGSYEKSIIADAEDPNFIVRLFSGCRVAKGTLLTKDMITVKRANFGIFPESFDDVLERKVTMDIEEDVPLTWEMFN